jgi:hypothetical protein
MGPICSDAQENNRSDGDALLLVPTSGRARRRDASSPTPATRPPDAAGAPLTGVWRLLMTIRWVIGKPMVGRDGTVMRESGGKIGYSPIVSFHDSKSATANGAASAGRV